MWILEKKEEEEEIKYVSILQKDRYGEEVIYIYIYQKTREKKGVEKKRGDAQIPSKIKGVSYITICKWQNM